MRLARFLTHPAGTALLYFLLASASVAFARLSDGVAMAWIASALLAGRLVHLPPSSWRPWLVYCALASGLATGLFGLGWGVCLPLAVINVAEAAGAALVWQRITAWFWPNETLEWVVSFYIGVGLIVPLASGGLGAFTTWAIIGLPLISNFVHWIIAHALGLLACLPVFQFIYVRLASGRSFLPSARQVPLATVVIGAFATLTILVFTLNMRALLVFPLVYLVVSTAVLSSSIVALMPLLLLGIGGTMTVLGHGPIASMPLDFGDRIQFFQLYVSVAVLGALPLGCERHRRILEMRLMQQRIAELEQERGAGS